MKLFCFKLCHNDSKDVLRCEGGEELERIAATSRNVINQCFQEPAGQVLDRASHSMVTDGTFRQHSVLTTDQCTAIYRCSKH